MVHSPMAGVWRHPQGAGNRTGLLSSGGFQVHLLRCTEVEESSGGEESKAPWRKLSGASLHSQHHPQTHPNLHPRGFKRCAEPVFSSASLLWVHLTPFTSETAAVFCSRTCTHTPDLTHRCYSASTERHGAVCAHTHPSLVSRLCALTFASLTASRSNSQVHVSLSKQGFGSLHVLRPSITSS